MARSAAKRIKESGAVKFFRSSAVIVLAGSAILLSTVSFTMSNRKELDDFEKQVREARCEGPRFDMYRKSNSTFAFDDSIKAMPIKCLKVLIPSI